MYYMSSHTNLHYLCIVCSWSHLIFHFSFTSTCTHTHTHRAYKILLIGESSVGKTTLATRLCEDRFMTETKQHTLGVCVSINALVLVVATYILTTDREGREGEEEDRNGIGCDYLWMFEQQLRFVCFQGLTCLRESL